MASPRETAQRLSESLVARRPGLRRWDEYYRGAHPSPYVPADRIAEYRALLGRARANFMAPVIDIVAERLRVSGVRSEVDGLADDMWGWWQVSQMDARQARLFRSTLKHGIGYIVQVQRGEQILMRTHSPMHMTHEVDPRDPETVTVAAAFWGVTDSVAPHRYARLFTPDEWIDLELAPGGWKVLDSQRHRVGEVPVVPVLNLPDDAGGYRSDLDGLTEIQDRINQTLADRLMAQTYGAHRQRLIMGWTPEEDANGNAVWPFRPGVNRTWTIENSDARVAEFSETQLQPYLEATKSDLQVLAAVSRRPAPYLLGGENPPSAEALDAAEKSGMSAVVAERKADFGEAVEHALNQCAKAHGRPTDPRLEVVWKDLDPHSEAAVVDAAVKKATSLRVPFIQIWRELGYSPQQIEEFPLLLAAMAAASSDAPRRPSARDMAEMVQKLYLGVGKVISPEEARQVLRDAGMPLERGTPGDATNAIAVQGD